MKLGELLDYTGQLLQVDRFRDYCPNGLQVEGRSDVGSIVTGVSASLALLQAAAELGADLVLVHHGWFWKSEDARVTGIKRDRLKFLLQRDISLVGYHLPLDAHPELGNNARLAAVLGFETEGWFGEQPIAAHGRLSQPASLAALGQSVAQKFDRTPLLVGDGSATIRRIAWCSGAAQDYLAQAIALGVDAFLTGEVSEHTVHLARESGVAFIAAGHHATERYGVQALGEHLAERFGIGHQYIEIPNPV
ncbi:MAG TPA: Nif3-like dinuclear metal center hexameric protein [Methylophilaceae bacterium]|nr:Nif3-like dinuclear metal center hexameric protein [Methylophilaceae bacterium]HQR61253.1 Nif3-like dinuclear metal center hexameric protein [Methylophilaceae bacterium]